MSKLVKQMQMDVLAKTFAGVKDLLFLTATKVDSQTDNKVRLGLRKKNISLMMVKNSLLRRVFEGKIDPGEVAYVGSTLIAWGGDSIKELSREVEAAVLKDAKLKDKVKVKTAVAEGQALPFERALTMPTRKEAIGEVVAALLGPASGIAACLTGPAAQVAGQIQTIAEKKPEEGAPAA